MLPALNFFNYFNAGRTTEIVIDVHTRTGHEVVLSPAIISTRRRSYASSGTTRGNNSSGSGGGNGLTTGAMTHSKTAWLNPTIRITSPPRCNPASDRRLSGAGGRRTSASLESTPFAQVGNGSASGSTPMIGHQRVRSCDTDSATGGRCHAKAFVAAAVTTTSTLTCIRPSPVASRHVDVGRLVESRIPSCSVISDSTSGVTTFPSTHSALSPTTVAALAPKPTTNASPITCARPTLKAKPSCDNRVPRYNDPGSFEEVNEDLLYNKQVFNDGDDSTKVRTHSLPPLVRRPPTTAPLSGIGIADRRHLNVDEISVTATSVGEGDAGNRPTSPGHHIGNSVQLQYRELWDLRATIEEQECQTAIRLEAASSPEPEMPDENVVLSTGAAGTLLGSTTGVTDSRYAPLASGNRLEIPISRRQMYRSVIENRLNQRRCCSNTSVACVSPTANLSIDSFETDGDLSDTSRHDVTTTSFESSTTTTTTTDNNTDCTSDARAPTESRHPTSSIPQSTWTRSIETPAISGSSLSQCTASVSDTTGVPTSSTVGDSKPQPLTSGSGPTSASSNQWSRSLLSNASSTSSVGRSAAKKRRDFRKYERSAPVYPFDGEQPEIDLDYVCTGDTFDGPDRTGIDSSDAAFRPAASPLSSWVTCDTLGSQRRGHSTADSFRASMSNWWYHRHSDASSGFRDYRSAMVVFYLYFDMCMYSKLSSTYYCIIVSSTACGLSVT